MQINVKTSTFRWNSILRSRWTSFKSIESVKVSSTIKLTGDTDQWSRVQDTLVSKYSKYCTHWFCLCIVLTASSKLYINQWKRVNNQPPMHIRAVDQIHEAKGWFSCNYFEFEERNEGLIMKRRELWFNVHCSSLALHLIIWLVNGVEFLRAKYLVHRQLVQRPFNSTSILDNHLIGC